MTLLERELRRNKGRRLRAGFAASVADWFNRPPESVETLSIEDTDALVAAAKVLRAETRRFTGSAQRTEAESLLRRLRRAHGDDPMILLATLSEYCGGVVTSMHEVLDNTFNVVSLDGEWLRAYAADGRLGIRILWDTEAGGPLSSEPVIEVHLLGDW